MHPAGEDHQAADNPLNPPASTTTEEKHRGRLGRAVGAGWLLFRALLLTVLSALTLALLVLWIASHVPHQSSWVEPNWEEGWTFYPSEKGWLVTYGYRSAMYDFTICGGGLVVRWAQVQPPGAAYQSFTSRDLAPIARVAYTFKPGRSWWEVRTGIPILLILVAAYPISWASCRTFSVLRRRRRERRGRCLSCGYSLTGNTSGICPECGTPNTPGSQV